VDFRPATLTSNLVLYAPSVQSGTQRLRTVVLPIPIRDAFPLTVCGPPSNHGCNYFLLNQTNNFPRPVLWGFCTIVVVFKPALGCNPERFPLSGASSRQVPTPTTAHIYRDRYCYPATLTPSLANSLSLIDTLVGEFSSAVSMWWQPTVVAHDGGISPGRVLVFGSNPGDFTCWLSAPMW